MTIKPTLKVLFNRIRAGDDTAIEALVSHYPAAATQAVRMALNPGHRVRPIVTTNDILQELPLKLYKVVVKARAAAAADLGCLQQLAQGGDPKQLGTEVKKVRGQVYLIPTGKGAAEKRLLKNVVVHIDKSTGDRETDASGVFEVEFSEPQRAGHDVVLKVRSKDEDLVLIHPDLKGRLRLPPPGEAVEVWVVRKGDKFILTNQTIERFVADVADANAKVPLGNEPKTAPDLPRELKRLADDLNLKENAVMDRFEEWLAGAAMSKDDRTLALAAFARKEYQKAEDYSLRGAARHLELAGDSAVAGLREANAVKHYTTALEQLDEKRDREQWTSVSYKLARAKGAFFMENGPPQVSNQELVTAIDFLRQRVKTLDAKSDGYAVAAAQANLGFMLGTLAERGAGVAAHKLLEEAVQSNKLALVVFTQRRYPLDWATTQVNLGYALRAQGERAAGAKGAKLLGDADAANRTRR